MPASVLDKVRSTNGIANAEGGIFDFGATVLTHAGQEDRPRAAIIASRRDNQRYELFDVAPGRLPSAADEVAIDKSTADRKHLKVGDQILIAAQQPKQTFTDRRDHQDRRASTRSAARPWRCSRCPRRSGSPARSTSSTRSTRRSSRAATRRPSSATCRRALGPTRARAHRQGGGREPVQGHPRQPRLPAHRAARLRRHLAVRRRVHHLQHVLDHRRAADARVRAAAHARRLARARCCARCWARAWCSGFVGALVGLGLGIALAAGPARRCSRRSASTLPSNGTVIQSRTIIVSLVVGVVVTLVVDARARRIRATRVPPVAALREGFVRRPGRRSRFATPVGIAMLLGGLGADGRRAVRHGLVEPRPDARRRRRRPAVPRHGAAQPAAGPADRRASSARPMRGITGRLARENAMRQPGRTAATAAALMVGVALVAFASIFAASARKTIHDAVSNGSRAQFIVQNTDGFSSFSPLAAKRVAQVPGVHEGQPRSASPRARSARTTCRSRRRRPGDLLRSLQRRRAPTQLRNLKPGERLRLQGLPRRPPSGRGGARQDRHRCRRCPLRVAGIYNDKGHLLSDLTITNDQAAQRLRGGQGQLRLRRGDRGQGARRMRIKAALKTDFPQTEALTNKEFIDNQAGQINQVLVLIYALLALAIIVSLFGIVNTLVLSITERTRELGMLRAIGTSRRQVRKMIRYEAIITALLGGILGAVLGVLLALVVSRPLERLQAVDPVRQPDRAAGPERVRRRAGARCCRLGGRRSSTCSRRWPTSSRLCERAMRQAAQSSAVGAEVADLGAAPGGRRRAGAASRRRRPPRRAARRARPGAARPVGERGLVERAGGQVEAHADGDGREAEAAVVVALAERDVHDPRPDQQQADRARAGERRDRADRHADRAVARRRPRSPRPRRGGGAARSGSPGRAAAARGRSAAR